MMGEGEKGRVCVTGGTGFLASWLIMKLLQQGYSVNTTIRSHPDNKKDVSYLTSLPGASTRLQIFNADLSKPETFEAPIKGCIGVFHLAHPIDLSGKEPEEVQTKRAMTGAIGVLQACLDSTTVKKVVYTSSVSAMLFNDKNSEMVDEESWSDVNFIRANFKDYGAPYFVSKTLTEKAVLEFGEKNGIDVVSVIPTFIHGPFLCPNMPASLRTTMAMIFGEKDQYNLLIRTSFVHIDDAANALLYLFECANAKGRYICAAEEFTLEKLYNFVSARYPEYQIPSIDFLKDVDLSNYPGISSRKLLETGFKYKYGFEEMFDGAIESCKRIKIL